MTEPAGSRANEDWFFVPPALPPDGRPQRPNEPTQPIPAVTQTQPVRGWPPAPPPFGPTTGGIPGHTTTPAGRGPRSGLLLTAAASIALVASLLGGGVALLGERMATGWRPGSASPLPPPGPGSTARPDGSIAKIAATALPSVVTIKIKGADGSGTGSGFVIDKQGHVLTNNHVVSSVADSGTITVRLSDNSAVPATIVGRDASYDLAVLKVGRTDLVPLAFGRSSDVVVGDGVIAVGAPLGLDATVTSGIVSALNRPVTPGGGDEQSFINAIQTDAAINPGNSGGPLLDMNGKVIGVNSAIARIPGTSSTIGGNIGVGFSIPSDQAYKTAQQLITTGKAEHPMIGVRIDRKYDGEGAKLADDQGVTPSGPAAKAGLKDGDIIVEFEGKKLLDADQLIVEIRSRSVGDTVTLKVKRGGQTIDVRMTLQAAPG